jgi:hypothetical protein
MPRGRKPGVKNRNYPALALADARLTPQKIADEASGTTVSKLALSGLLDVSPASSKFRDLVTPLRVDHRRRKL